MVQFLIYFWSMVFLPQGHIMYFGSPTKHTVEVSKDLEESSLNQEVFTLAYDAYSLLKDSLKLKENIISVVDFSQPSTAKRFYLIDIENKRIIYQNYVAHGRNTGVLNAEKFSNIPHSNQSSLGFYKTGETYYGKHGLSLKLDGLEEGINHLARKRHIVVHQAWYAEQSFVDKYGRLGRSFGCPAIPAKGYKKVIETIKDGTLFFIYYPQKEYLTKSKIINQEKKI